MNRIYFILFCWELIILLQTNGSFEYQWTVISTAQLNGLDDVQHITSTIFTFSARLFCFSVVFPAIQFGKAGSMFYTMRLFFRVMSVKLSFSQFNTLSLYPPLWSIIPEAKQRERKKKTMSRSSADHYYFNAKQYKFRRHAHQSIATSGNRWNYICVFRTCNHKVLQ